MRVGLAWSLAMAIAGAGCGEDGGAEPDAAPGCATDLVHDATFDIDPHVGSTQINPDAVFDGRTVWLVYNLLDGEEGVGFDVFALRLNCDGTRVGDRMRVTTSTGRDDRHPAIAVGDGNAYVVWQANDKVEMVDLDIVYRTFRTDGTPIMATDADLETYYEGEPLNRNTYYPDVAALPGGMWAVSGVRSLPGVGTFKAFVQRLGAGGNLHGQAIDGQEVDGTHSSTSIAARADGSLFLSWLRRPDEEVVHTTLLPGAEAFSRSPIAPVEHEGAHGLSHAVGPDEQVYLAFGVPGESTYSAGDVVLARGDIFNGVAPSIRLGESGRSDRGPTVAAAPGGGAVAWHRGASGPGSAVAVQPFTHDDAGFTLGEETTIATNTEPGKIALTHVEGDAYFIAWSDNRYSPYELRGRFIRLPAP